jgi:hypothetical protein
VPGGVGLAQEHGQRFFGENTCHVLGVKEEEVRNLKGLKRTVPTPFAPNLKSSNSGGPEI